MKVCDSFAINSVINLRQLLSSLLIAALPTVILASTAPTQIRGEAPVTVSAANYKNTPIEKLVVAVNQSGAVLNPQEPALKPLEKAQRFVFVRGEIFEADLTYDQVTALLNGALAKKGFVNAADNLGRIYEPENVGLLLRITFGERLWRLPIVRTEGLRWRDGMVEEPRGPGLQFLGGDKVWDERAGGDDAIFGMLATNSASGQKIPGGPETSLAGTELGSSRDFEMIVVDAFDYQEVRKKGKYAKRIWTTFVSAPKQPHQKFSQVAEILVRNATPFFGETSQGLQIYTDSRAHVSIGEVTEVKDTPQK